MMLCKKFKHKQGEYAVGGYIRFLIFLFNDLKFDKNRTAKKAKLIGIQSNSLLKYVKRHAKNFQQNSD